MIDSNYIKKLLISVGYNIKDITDTEYRNGILIIYKKNYVLAYMMRGEQLILLSQVDLPYTNVDHSEKFKIIFRDLNLKRLMDNDDQ